MNASKLLSNKLSMGIFKIIYFCIYSQESLGRSKAYDKWFSPYLQHPLEKKSGHRWQVICDCGSTHAQLYYDKHQSIMCRSHTLIVQKNSHIIKIMCIFKCGCNNKNNLRRENLASVFPESCTCFRSSH